VEDAEEAVQMCVLADQLSDPETYWDVTPTSMGQLTRWWLHRMACGVDVQLTDDQYLNIVAR
jgi:hypothetical protein